MRGTSSRTSRSGSSGIGSPRGHQDTVLVPNLRLTSTQKDHELDVVVLMPGVGIVVVEVKGGSVSVDGRVGGGRAGGNRRSRIRPVDQCRDGKYALRAFVEGDPRWKAQPQPGALGPRDRRAVHGRRRRLRDPRLPALDDQRTGRPRRPRRPAPGRRRAAGERPTRADADDVELILEILTGRSFPAPTSPPRPTSGRLPPTGSRRSRPRCSGHAPHHPHGGPRGSGQRQDDPRPHPGQGPDPRAGGAQAAAGRAALLLDRAVAVLQAAARRGDRGSTAPRSSAPSRTSRTSGASRPTTTATTPTSGSGTSPRRWPRSATGCPRARGSTRSSSTRRRTSPTTGGTRS